MPLIIGTALKSRGVLGTGKVTDNIRIADDSTFKENFENNVLKTAVV